ncbi:cytochrome [Dapis sp. BLCC M126]|uniref:SLOG cluster 4 domain-containing protein n=1 Tax=Dapis sp. BLCC M126 TaxID=3400189 RepID=UPI003CF9BFED
MKKIIIGVMGAGSGATSTDLKNAYKLGQLIAQESWVLLTGGRNMGVMDAASRGAKSVNGLTIGILPGNNLDGISEAVDIPIVTASEVALAIKNNKKVILLGSNLESQAFFVALSPETVFVVDTPESAIERIKNLV